MISSQLIVITVTNGQPSMDDALMTIVFIIHNNTSLILASSLLEVINKNAVEKQGVSYWKLSTITQAGQPIFSVRHHTLAAENNKKINGLIFHGPGINLRL